MARDVSRGHSPALRPALGQHSSIHKKYSKGIARVERILYTNTTVQYSTDYRQDYARDRLLLLLLQN